MENKRLIQIPVHPFIRAEVVHTQEHPYCKHLFCPCHNSAAYHRMVIRPRISEAEVVLALGFFGVTPLPPGSCFSSEEK